MDKFKPRAHYCGTLTSLPQSKAAKERGELGKTAQSKIIEAYLFEKYGYKKSIESKYITKGLYMEEKSIELLSDIDGDLYMKNVGRRENEYLSGEADIITDDSVIDIKTNWDLGTFATSSLSKEYEWQLRAYMELYDKDYAELVYVLHDATDEMIENEIDYIIRKYTRMDEEFETIPDMKLACEEEINQVKLNLKVEHKMPPEKRIKRFGVERDEERTAFLYECIEKARDFYETINL